MKIPFAGLLAVVTTNVWTMKNVLKGDVAFSVPVTRAAQLASFVSMDSVLLDVGEMESVLLLKHVSTTSV